MNRPQPAGRASEGNARSATRPPRKRARRGRQARILRDINDRAAERQGAWLETGQRDLTDALTRKLDRDFQNLRTADREDYANGTPEGEPYRGKTQRIS